MYQNFLRMQYNGLLTCHQQQSEDVSGKPVSQFVKNEASEILRPHQMLSTPLKIAVKRFNIPPDILETDTLGT